MVEKQLNVVSKLSDKDKQILPHWLSEEGLFMINGDQEASLFGSQDNP